MVIKKDIVYPIFLKCCDFTEDNFWKCVFEDLAYGKPVYGTYIVKDFICCSYKGKEFSYKIDVTKDAELVHKEIYHLLNKKLGLCSQTDRNKRRETFQNIEQRIKNIRTSNWSAIKKKGIKELIIENFVIDMKATHNLSVSQAKRLLAFISICLIFKVITSADIHYENGKIEKIEGIRFKPKKIILEKSLKNCDVGASHDIVFDKNTMSDVWEKYLSNLLKQI